MKRYDNPCVMFSGGYGDYVISLPAIRYFAKYFGNTLKLISGSEIAFSVYKHLSFKNVIHSPFFSGDNTHFRDLELSEYAKGCELLISLCPFQGGEISGNFSSLLNRVSPKYSVGLFACFDYEVPFVRKNMFDLLFDIPKVFDKNADIDDFSYPMKFDENILQYCHKIRNSLPDGVKLLTLQAHTKTNKEWDYNRFAALADRLCSRDRNLYIFIVGFNGEKILSQCQHRNRIFCFGEKHKMFEASCALVSISDFFIGVDSVFLHVADLCRVPSVAIFGPTSTILWGCRFADHVHVTTSSRKMSDIAVDEVEYAFTALKDRLTHPDSYFVCQPNQETPDLL